MAQSPTETPNETDSTPGNQPSAPKFGPDELKQAEEESIGRGSPINQSSTAPGKINFTSDEAKQDGSGDLSTPTGSGKNKVGYNTSDEVPAPEQSLYNSSATQKGRLRFGNFLGTRRRKAIFGGGVVGTIIGTLMFFSFFSGPFEFIHIAQLLEKFHFAGLQSQQDDRFAKEVRLARFASNGEVEKTRLGFLGNKFADRFETKISTSGLSSSYTDKFGLFDGYVIDRTNEKFKGMSDEQIKQYVQENYGVEPVKGSSIKGASTAMSDELVVDASKLGYVKTYKLTYGILRESGYSKLSASVGARYLCQRAACTSMLHPLSKQISSGKRALEDWWNKRGLADREGSVSPELGTQEDPSAQNDPAKKGSADSVKGEVEADKTLSAKDFSVKLGGSALAVAGVLCIAKGAAADAHNLKASQIQVLMRMAVESMALGSQLQTGQDVNLNQLAQYNTLLHGTDAQGNKTSWDQSESIQANLGKSNTGTAPDKTLQGVTNDSTPFDFLKIEPLGTILGAVCSTPGQIISFLGGGLEGLVTGAVASIILQQTNFSSDLAHWLAGNAIDVNAVGADYGSEVDYGAALASNSQAVLAGGSALSSSQAAYVQSTTNTIARDEFNRQSLAHKLLNPYDNQSAISKVIDSSSSNVPQNIAKMGSQFVNLANIFSVLPKLFQGSAHAAIATGFNYGFPTYGFSQTDMSSPTYENPYENACYVVGCDSENVANNQSRPIVGFLTGSTNGTQLSAAGSAYADMAKQCFGATISAVAVQDGANQLAQWNVTSSGGALPNPYDAAYPKGCNNNSDPNWTRLRFFIMDTETMNSMSCYQGDNQACSDIGFNSSSSTTTASGTTATTTTGTGPVDEGTNSQLAQKILDYQKSGQYTCDPTNLPTNDCTDLQKIVSGQSLSGSDGCTAQTLDPRVLKLVLYIIEQGGFKIGTSAMCGDHSKDRPGGHSGGFAVDIDNVNGANLGQNTPNSGVQGVKLDQFLNNLPSTLKLDQQISYGYGGNYYKPMADLQQFAGQLCASSCISDYTLTVEDEHTNHIHSGF